MRFIGRHSNQSHKYRDFSEKKAEEYLVNKGYKILERNLRIGYLEMDLIAEKDNTIVFIEVKRRDNIDFGEPEKIINKKKIDKMINFAKLFLMKKDYRDYDVRFDVLTFSKEGLQHIEDAFRESST